MNEEEILAYIDSTMADAVKVVMDKLPSRLGSINSNEIDVPMLIDRLNFSMESSGRNHFTFTISDMVTGYRKAFVFNLQSSRGYAYPSPSEILF